MYFVYILQSEKSQRYYIGSTENVQMRLVRHNTGKVVATKNKGPWNIVYMEEFLTRQSAYGREMEIKSYKGGNNFKKLLVRAPR
jgi:putative endonuclease